MGTKLTASKCLELLNKNELEGNLTTILKYQSILVESKI